MAPVLGTVTSNNPAVLDSLVTQSVIGTTQAAKGTEDTKPKVLPQPVHKPQVPSISPTSKLIRPKPTAAAGSKAQLFRVKAEMQTLPVGNNPPGTAVIGTKPSQTPKVNQLPFTVNLVRLMQCEIDKHTESGTKTQAPLIQPSQIRLQKLNIVPGQIVHLVQPASKPVPIPKQPVAVTKTWIIPKRCYQWQTLY